MEFYSRFWPEMMRKIVKSCKRYISTEIIQEKYEYFSWFLNGCECSHDIEMKIWDHVKKMDACNDESYKHVKPWFNAKETMKRIEPENELQKGCFDIIPGLTGNPIWNKDKFGFIERLENEYNIIRDELMGLINDNNSNGYQNYKNSNDMGSTDKGHWNVYYFYLNSMVYYENIKHFPNTMNIIDSINNYEYRLFNHALISCLSGDSHITKHNGPTNKKLRVYMPILMENDMNILFVGNNKIILSEGKCVVFDDSFIHEAWNYGNKSRFVLIFDIYHPELSSNEIEFLELIQNVYETNLLKKAKIMVNNGNLYDINNPYVAMLNEQYKGINSELIYNGWR